MTATEELRRMLDERGLSHPTHYLHTSWCVGSKLYVAMDNLDGTLTVDNLTPEQAIAATLGSEERTCKLSFGNDNLPECGNCGEPLCYYTSRHGLEPKNRRSAYYCPRCGAKVVG